MHSWASTALTLATLCASPALAQSAQDDRPYAGPVLLAQLLPVPMPPSSPPPPAAAPPVLPPLREPKLYPEGRIRGGGHVGWAIGAGVTGVFAAATTLGFAIGAETVRHENALAPLALTTISSLVAIIMVPVVATGGSAARHRGVSGLEGMRIFGWIFYAVGIGLGVASFITPLTHDGAPPGLLTSSGALFATSALFMAVDDFVSYGQYVRDWGHACREIAPYATPLVAANGRGGLSAGVMGCF